MNIQVPFKWIKQYTDTKLSAIELAELLPTRGPQVEKVYWDENLKDDVFDIEITSNRIDTASVVGIAREIASITNSSFALPQSNITFPSTDSKRLSVEIKDFDKCKRFNAVVIEGIQVKASPDWLKSRLESLGKNSINNLVDISNYVLLEYGYPTHIFDYEKIQDNKIIVRKATDGEEFVSLDNDSYELDSNDLVIADTQKIISLAGIKGGLNSGVSERTHTIVIEAANFESYGIRKTARRLDLHTDASSLFEKNLSALSSEVALKRVVELVLELAGGEIASSLKDEKRDDVEQTVIEFDTSRVKRILGIELSKEEIIQILESLDFKCVNQNDSKLSIEVPHFRANDVMYDYDLVEEIGRIYGYENIVGISPDGSIPPVSSNAMIEWEDKIKDILVGAGLTEAFNLSIVGDLDLKRVGIESSDVIEISNPLTEDYKYMRRELTSSMISTLLRNEDFKSALELFEINAVYLPNQPNVLPNEEVHLTIMVSSATEESAYRQTKGYFEHLLKTVGLSVESFSYIQKNYPFFQSNMSADIKIDDDLLGYIGILASSIDAKRPACILEVNLTLLLKYILNTVKSFKGIHKYQSIKRDFAFVLRNTVKWKDIFEIAIRSNELITHVELFDIYKGKGIENGKKSVAFSITIQPKDKTLTEEEITGITSKLIHSIETQLEGVLRSI